MDTHRPNIILILADDMGYSDIGCFGSEIATPNLDRMASEGVRFTQMYNCARCCPSRASLLTGLYPHQAGVGHMTTHLGHPSYQGYLNDRCMTIAEVLGESGYTTLMSGKWHVGGKYNIQNHETWRLDAAPHLSAGHPSAGHPIPTDRGFQRFYGTLEGCGSYYNPHTLMEDGRFLYTAPDDFYYTDAISDRAIAMIEDHCGARASVGGPHPGHGTPQPATPFFLFVAYTAPHWPLHAPPEDIARYEGRYRDGWDSVRKDRHDRMVEKGILDESWKISPRDEAAPPWEEVREKDWEDMRMAVYAAQIDRMDQGIGRILNQLKKSGIDENTMVIFLSDNGGCAEFLAENGMVQNLLYPMRNGEQVRAGNFPGVMPGQEDTYMSYDLPWANASNTPFRLFKHWVHEGGIATPLLVSWPKATKRSTTCHAPMHVVDIMASCIDAAGASYADEFKGKSIPPLEGESFLPALKDESWRRESPIYWEHEGNCAIRQQDWKMAKKYPGDWELYNMERDRTELKDLRQKNEPKVQELMKLYDEWFERCDILPWERLIDIAPW